MKTRLLLLMLLSLLLALPGFSQFRDGGMGGGIGFGHTFGHTELRDKVGKFHARAFLRYGMTSAVQGELGVGLGGVEGTEYRTMIVPIDYRFVFSPFSFESWNPFLYAGFGGLYYDIEKASPERSSTVGTTGWTGYAPGGLGLQFVLHDNVLFEMSGGFNYTLNDDWNTFNDGSNDAYWSYQVGLTIAGESPDADPDKDGLTNREEKQLGTDRKNPDTDGDGLSDGDEVKKYNTNPLKADSDGDGLSDYDEVMTHKTNPNLADTDGDGLNDYDEVMKYKTNPVKADTDGDGLNDGDEVLKYKTDPLKADTDSDGLNDGDEVLKHKTDPLKADTDGGTVDDGTEVARGTNPLNPADDIKKEVLKVEVGKAIVLEGIVFATGKSDITPESETILQTALNTLEENAEITVEIHGHTDNTGSKATNKRLSLARADAVKAWLVQKGISADRIGTKGFGPDKPAVPNTTPEGRQQNRRIEFFRVK